MADRFDFSAESIKDAFDKARQGLDTHSGIAGPESVNSFHYQTEERRKKQTLRAIVAAQGVSDANIARVQAQIDMLSKDCRVLNEKLSFEDAIIDKIKLFLKDIEEKRADVSDVIQIVDEGRAEEVQDEIEEKIEQKSAERKEVKQEIDALDEDKKEIDQKLDVIEKKQQDAENSKFVYHGDVLSVRDDNGAEHEAGIFDKMDYYWESLSQGQLESAHDVDALEEEKCTLSERRAAIISAYEAKSDCHKQLSCEIDHLQYQHDLLSLDREELVKKLNELDKQKHEALEDLERHETTRAEVFQELQQKSRELLEKNQEMRELKAQYKKEHGHAYDPNQSHHTADSHHDTTDHDDVEGEHDDDHHHEEDALANEDMVPLGYDPALDETILKAKTLVAAGMSEAIPELLEGKSDDLARRVSHQLTLQKIAPEVLGGEGHHQDIKDMSPDVLKGQKPVSCAMKPTNAIKACFAGAAAPEATKTITPSLSIKPPNLVNDDVPAIAT